MVLLLQLPSQLARPQALPLPLLTSLQVLRVLASVSTSPLTHAPTTLSPTALKLPLLLLPPPPLPQLACLLRRLRQALLPSLPQQSLASATSA